MPQILSEYENYIKQLLLSNFYFEELLGLMGKMQIDPRHKTKEEVFVELDRRVEESDGTVIISELDRILEHGEVAVS